jgi:hypothetical protein
MSGWDGKDFNSDGEQGGNEMKEDEKPDVCRVKWSTWLDSAGIEIVGEVDREEKEGGEEIEVAGVSNEMTREEVVGGGRAEDKIDLKTGERESGKW